MLTDAGAWRLLAAVLMAAATALAVDRWTEARGYLPPGFAALWRRAAALAVITGIFFVGIFLPVALFGVEREAFAPEEMSTPELFLLQGLLLLSLVVWFLLGFAGVRSSRPAAALATTVEPEVEAATPGGPEPGSYAETRVARALERPAAPLASTFARQLGLLARRPLAELGIGLAAGAAGWVMVILLMLAVVAVVWALGGEEVLPTEPPELIPWVAGLPLLVRTAIGVTAGVVEELFFRGFLQPRVGIALSSALFVMAHLSYEQPFMLIGIAALSLLFAALVRWRRTILPAIAAHAVFDLIQLLIVVPQVLRYLPEVS